MSEADRQLLERGHSVYKTHCRPCHMSNGKSPIKRLCFADGEWKNGDTLQDIQRVITEGVDATQMRPFGEKLSADEIDVVSRYVKSLEAVDP